MYTTIGITMYGCNCVGRNSEGKGENDVIKIHNPNLEDLQNTCVKQQRWPNSTIPQRGPQSMGLCHGVG